MGIVAGTVDLTGAVVGASGSINLASLTPSGQTGYAATVQLYNESGCGLFIWFGLDAQRQFVPAGGWRAFRLRPGEVTVNYTVAYVLPNAPVATLVAIYYEPSETVPDIGVLGNSPIGGGVDVTATSEIISIDRPDGNAIITARPLGAADIAVDVKNNGQVVIRTPNNGLAAFVFRIIPGVGGGPAILTFGDPADPSVCYLFGTASDALHAFDSDQADLALDSQKVNGKDESLLDVAHAVDSDEATHAVNADDSLHADNADDSLHADLADVATVAKDYAVAYPLHSATGNDVSYGAGTHTILSSGIFTSGSTHLFISGMLLFAGGTTVNKAYMAKLKLNGNEVARAIAYPTSAGNAYATFTLTALEPVNAGGHSVDLELIVPAGATAIVQEWYETCLLHVFTLPHG